MEMKGWREGQGEGERERERERKEGRGPCRDGEKYRRKASSCSSLTL